MNIRKFALVAMTLSAMGFSSMNAQTAASAVDGKKQTIYSSVNHASTPYRIPAVATLNNGTVLAIADQRPCGADVGNGEVDIYAKVGTIAANGSYSWNPSAIDPSVSGGLKIADGDSSNGYGDAAVVVDRESGKVLVICVSGKVVFSSGSSSKHNKMARIVGSADGLSWETPQDVTTAFFDNLLPSAYTMFMASGRMIQSQHVKVGNYYRIYGVLLVREKSGWFSKSNNNYVVYSDDFGASWTLLGGGIAVSGGDESAVEELPNGNVLISSRKYSSPGSTSVGRRSFRVFKYSSLPTAANTANGSWESSTYSGIQWQGTWKGTNGELLLVPAKDASGNSCYILLNSVPYGTSEAEGRGNVSIFWKKLSSDAITTASEFSGTNWNRYPVSTTTSAYSTMVLQHDGTIACAYEETIWGKGYNAPAASYSAQAWTELGYDLRYQTLTLDEITSNQYSYDDGEEEEPVVEVVETPVFSIAGGEVEEGTEVTISCATDGATVYYTTDGNDPTTASAVYSGAIAINSAMTIKAMAAKENCTNSAVATASFTIKASESEGGETTTVTKYRFKNVQVYGTVRYFAYDSTNGLTLTTDVNAAHLYTRTTVDAANGVYNFQSEDGNYLVWKGSAEGYNNNVGYTASYYATVCDLTVKELTTSDCYQCVSSGVPDGYVYITGKRSDETSDGVFIVSSSGSFDKTTKPFYTSSYSSAFVIEAVEIEVEGEEEEPVVEVVDTPVFSIAGGEVEEGTEVTISCATSGATVYYTTDGTEPTTASAVYCGAIAVNSVMTIKAIAAKDGYTDSEVASATFTIKAREVVATPVINPAGGEVEEGTTVTISCATSGATIYYTTDGNEPTIASAVYGGAIVVDKDMTIKAFAAKDGYYTNSSVAAAAFTIKVEAVAVSTPVISPAGGEVEEGTQVTISCATEGATVYYTTDGTEPTTSSAVYSGAITVNSAMTIKAMAAKSGNYTNSGVATATFTIKEVIVEPETPVEPEEPETPVIDEALQQAIVAAQEVSAYCGVGYPTSSAATRVALDNVIADAQEGNATTADLESAVSAFKNEVNSIQMPEDGVTYKFVNVALNGTKYYIKYASSGISMTTDESQATEYTCEVISSDEYAFVASDGSYLIWKGPNGSEGKWFWKKTYGYNSNKGYVKRYYSTYCDLIVEKLTTGSNVSASSNADLFGMMAIQGMRYSRSEYGYFTIKSDGTFDASSDPYYNSSYSSAFYIVATGTAAKGSRIDGTTAVEEVTVERVADDAIYDLTGRKVTEMRAGEIYIQNGKKILKR